MKIDWSKAPEGATHYFHGSTDPWRDLSMEHWRWFADRRWNGGGPETGIDTTSAGLLKRRGSELEPRPVQGQKPFNLESEQTRQAIIALAAKQCGLSGDSIRQLATVLAAEGYRKFEIVEEEV